MLADLRHRVRSLFRRRRVERELDDELRFHLEQHKEKLIAEGVPAEEAERRARLALGGLEATKEDVRDTRGVGQIETTLQDLRYGLRVLRRSPGFTTVAVLTLALGIGANTALFSVVSRVLLEPLPFPEPERLVTLHESKPNFDRGAVPYLNFRDWEKRNHSFTAMALSRATGLSVTGQGPAVRVTGQFVTSEFFRVLGVAPALGRDLARGEDELGGPPVVLVGAGFWKRALGGGPDVVGRPLELEGTRYTIIGVLPADFDLTINGFQTSDVYLPIGQWGNQLLGNRAAGLGLHGIARLAPGVSLAQAQADLDSVTHALALEYPEANKGTGAAIIPFGEAMLGGVRPFLLVLLGAVGFVLLIACVNVANLLLARSAARGRELAIRAALGAGRRRLFRQLVTEGILLAVLGGGLGVALAALGTRAALEALPFQLPRAASVGLDVRALILTTVIALGAGVFFGAVPALLGGKTDLNRALKEGGHGVAGGRHRGQDVFVVAQVALALVLLVGAGLMLRTLGRLWAIDPGFVPERAVVASISLSPPRAEAPPDAIRAELRGLVADLEAVPGVTAVSLSWGALPMYGDDERRFWLDGVPRPSEMSQMSWALNYVVGPGYLDALGVPLRAGRFFAAADDEHAPAVAVVDELFARKYFPGEDPVGKRIDLDGGDGPIQIVGVVGHVKQWGLDTDEAQPLRAQLYLPFMQMGDSAMPQVAPGFNVVVRTRAHAPRVIESLREAAQRADSQRVIYDGRSLSSIIGDSLARRRVSLVLLLAFAALALLLAAVGLYGVISYAVTRRTPEIGLRVALGARRGDVLGLVLGHALRVTLVGVVVGLAAALALTRLMATLLYGVAPSDPITFASVAILLALVALAACLVPARRALRVDPMIALRHE